VGGAEAVVWLIEIDEKVSDEVQPPEVQAG